MPNDTPTPDFSSIEGHQIHDPSTISAAKPDTLGLGIQDIDPAHMAMDIGPALDHLTSSIENYTQTGRELHPVLSRLGDATRAAKELLVGGTTPMGPKEGLINNPVTAAMSMADAAPEVGAAMESSAKKAADYISDARAFHPNPEHGGVPISFDHIPGHQMETPSGPPTQKELVHVAPKDFIAKTNEGPVHTDTVNHYRQQIRSGEDVGPASITYDADGNIVGANGRHRALAHMQEGTERMPVEIHRPVAETPAKPTPKQIIEDQGLVYKGELTPGSHVHMFEDPAHPGKTAAMNEAENITPTSVKEKMASKLKDFGVGEKSTTPQPFDLKNTFYHGTKADIGQIEDVAADAHAAPTGLFGLGTYVTDSPEVASGYAVTKGKGAGRVLGVKIPEGKYLDAETQVAPHIKDDFEKAKPSDAEPLEGNTVRELFKSLRDRYSDAGWSTNDAMDSLQDLTIDLRKHGYDGIRYEGGKELGGNPHNVAVVFPDYEGRPIQLRSTVPAKAGKKSNSAGAGTMVGKALSKE